MVANGAGQMTSKRTGLFHFRFLAERRSERGVAMLSTLIVVIILGVIVTVVISEQSSSPPPSGSGTASVATTTTVPTTKTIGSDSQASTVSACEANFATMSTAIETYRALHGSAPPAGTAWATSSVGGSPILQSWMSSAVGYEISWNGSVLSVVPTKGAYSYGSYGTSTPQTGCFAA